VALAAGLGGHASPLSDEASGVGLAGRVAGADDVLAVTRALLEAAGPALAVQAVAWGILAATAGPVLRSSGARLRLVGAGWLSVAAAATVLGPALVGGPRVPFVPVVLAVVLAAILVGIRSVTRAAEPHARPVAS